MIGNILSCLFDPIGGGGVVYIFILNSSFVKKLAFLFFLSESEQGR